MGIRMVTSGLEIEIELSAEPESHLNVPFEDWIKCDIRFVVPGFTGAFPVRLELQDINRFLDELRSIDHTKGKPLIASLNGLDPGMSMVLSSNSFGRIFGKYEFCHKWGNVLNRLSGGFEMDQSAIHALIDEIQDSIQMLANHTEAGPVG